MENHLAYSGAASWIEVSEKALLNNIEVFRKISQESFSLGVVLKGNAYGHDIATILPVVHPKVDCIYVITPQDAFLVRDLELKLALPPRQIVVIGALTDGEIVECAKRDVEMALGDTSWAKSALTLKKLGLVAKVHVYLDTGLSREGFFLDSLEQDLGFLVQHRNVLTVKGVMSHFANTEDVTEQQYAVSQIESFKEGVSRIQSLLSLSDTLEKHLCASAAALVLPEARFNRVRIGISLYGYWPSTETRISAKLTLKKLPDLKPVLSWKCRSQVVKRVKKGTFVGYGCTYRCHSDSWIAVFPVGYYDGYPRLASRKAYVLVQGRRCPVIGRVMMNHIIVDVSHVVQDEKPIEAILIGKSEDETIPAETLAGWADTIQYEVVTRLGSHLRRVLVE